MPFGTDFDRKMSGNPWTRRPKISALEHGVADRRDAWVELSSRPERLQASLGWKRQNHQRERNGARLRVQAVVCQLCANNVLDRADIVRDGDFSTVMDGALPQWDWHDMQDRSRSSSISGQTEKVSTRQMC